MADTIRTKAEILTLLADNKSNNISPQDMRDVVVTIYEDMALASSPVWSISITYSIGDRVVYGNKIYQSLQNVNLANVPLTSPTFWVQIVPTGPYLYIGFALDANGTGFTTTPNPAFDFIAFKQSQTEILVLQQSDFNGLWMRYKNNAPIVGSNVYIAYADDAFGLNFTTTFNPVMEWIGIIASPTPLVPVVGDFAGKWKNYTGNSEFGLLTPSFSRNRNFVTDQFLRDIDGTPSNLAPYILPWNARLTAISMSNVGVTSSWTAEVYVNGVLLPGGSLSCVASTKNYNNLYAIDLNANDEISVYMNGVGIDRPKANLVLRRRT